MATSANLGSAYVEIETKVDKFVSGIGTAESALVKFANGAKHVGSTLMAVGIASTAALTAMMRPFMQFERSMAAVKAVSQATEEEFKRLEKTAMKMGQTTVFTASQSANALYYLASAGFSAEQQISALSAVLDLAAAHQFDLAETSRIVAAAISQFSLKAEDARMIVDTLASTISNSQATMAKLGTSLALAGPAAASSGFSFKEMASALGVMYQAGLDGSAAGTALRMMLVRLAKPTKEATKAMDRLNINFYKMTPDLQKITHEMDSASEAMNKQRRVLEKLNAEYEISREITLRAEESQSKITKEMGKNQLTLMKLQQRRSEMEEQGLEASEGLEKSITRIQNVMGRLAITEKEHSLNLQDQRDAEQELRREMEKQVKVVKGLENEYETIIEAWNVMPKTLKDSIPFMQEMSKLLGNLGDQARVFGVRQVTGAQALAKGTDVYVSLLNKAIEAQDLAAEQAEIQQNTLWGKLTKTKSAAEALSIIIGEDLAPIIMDFLENAVIPMIKSFTEWYKGLSEGKKNLFILTLAYLPVIAIVGILINLFASLIGWGYKLYLALKAVQAVELTSTFMRVVVGGTKLGAVLAYLKSLVLAIAGSTFVLVTTWIVAIAAATILAVTVWKLGKAIWNLVKAKKELKKWEEGDFSEEDLKNKKYKLALLDKERIRIKAIADDEKRAVEWAKHYKKFFSDEHIEGIKGQRAEEVQKGLEILKSRGETVAKVTYGDQGQLTYSNTDSLQALLSNAQAQIQNIPGVGGVKTPDSTMDPEQLQKVAGASNTTINANFDIENLDPNVDIKALVNQLRDLEGASSRLDEST